MGYRVIVVFSLPSLCSMLLRALSQLVPVEPLEHIMQDRCPPLVMRGNPASAEKLVLLARVDLDLLVSGSRLLKQLLTSPADGRACIASADNDAVRSRGPGSLTGTTSRGLARRVGP